MKTNLTILISFCLFLFSTTIAFSQQKQDYFRGVSYYNITYVDNSTESIEYTTPYALVQEIHKPKMVMINNVPSLVNENKNNEIIATNVKGYANPGARIEIVVATSDPN